MKILTRTAVAALVLLLPSLSLASPYESDEEEEGHYTSPVFRYFDSMPAAETAMRRDIKYAEEMRRHHQGAVEMSRAYLGDRRGINRFLRGMAEAIIANQRFEIDWLDDLRQRVGAGPEPAFGVGGLQLVRLPAGLTGFEHRARFQKAPVLSVTEPIAAQHPSEYDVMFAKAMTMHHQMALEMAHAYNDDPTGGNLVIQEINRGIIRDQKLEIGFLSDFIARYSGDPAAVQIEPVMHEMMGMPDGSQ